MAIFLFIGGHQSAPITLSLLRPIMLVSFAASVMSAGSSFHPQNTNGTRYQTLNFTAPLDGSPTRPDIVLKRDKRSLIFAGASSVKCVFGITAPVETSDKVNWRSLNLGYNFQAQYTPIGTVSFPWTRFGKKLERHKAKYDQDGSYVNDNTRNYAYKAYELFMESRGVNGKQCLFRAICEAAQEPINHGGVFEEVLHLFLNPSYEDAHSEYMDAKRAGQHGVDCSTLYAKCPMGSGLLDTISYFRRE